MIAEVLFTGTELILGQTLNTNSQILQQTLALLGIDLYYQVTAGDNLQRCAEAIKQAATRADLIVVGGGLGPTEDDVSREALAQALQVELQSSAQGMEVVKRFFVQRGLCVSEKNKKQALVPAGGEILDNPVGTAPGIWLEQEGKTYILLPGPPHEFKKMLQDVVVPRLKTKLGVHHSIIRSKVLHVCGIGEADLDECLGVLLKSPNPTVAPTAKRSEVHLRITAKAAEDSLADNMIASMEEQIRSIVGTHVYGTDEDTMPQVLMARLLQEKYRLGLGEGFTGGRLSSLLATAKGAEEVFAGSVLLGPQVSPFFSSLGFETFSLAKTEEKQKRQMLLKLKQILSCDICLLISEGLVYPKPDGSVDYTFWLGADVRGNVMSKEISVWGENRLAAADLAATRILVLLWRYLAHQAAF